MENVVNLCKCERICVDEEKYSLERKIQWKVRWQNCCKCEPWVASAGYLCLGFLK